MRRRGKEIKRTVRRTILALALVLTVATTALFSLRAWAGPGDDPSQVVARVGDQDITLGELMKREPAKMLDAANKYYEAENSVIEEAINNSILEQQAKKEHLTVPQLLDKHVRGTVKDPSDEALRVYYEGLQTDQTYDALKDQIKEHVVEGRLRRAMMAYAKSLRDSSTVVVMITPPKEDVAIGNAPVTGSRDAAVKVVEFADYECPYCRKVEPTLDKLRKEYGNRVAFAFKDFPLPMHKHAEKAAEAARCANAQGKFWDFHDKLFAADSSLEIAEMKTYARSMNLDGTKFDKCLDSGGEAAAIQKDQAEGSRLGLTGTPTFFVNGHIISGNASYETLRGLVDQELAAGASKSSSGGGM
jgi:protein-disulfide isomerase